MNAELQEVWLPAIKIEQPVGTFYAVSMSSDFLNKVSFSSRAEYKRKDMVDGVFSFLSGNQRELDDKRSKEIAKYIDSTEATFPNSLILGANVDKNGSFVTDKDKRWRIEEKDGSLFLVIPSDEKVATLIDGQHRLSGFKYSDRKNMQLLCSVFIDLPAPYQAYIFATININQKKVNKSLAYELYGFKLEDEEKEKWSPEKLAVYITRKLNKHSGLLRDKIKLGAAVEGGDDGIISLSTIVDGILKLITSNPKRDRDDLLNFKNKEGRAKLDKGTPSTPLRAKYIAYDDEYIESIVFDFFDCVDERLWKKQSKESYLLKTIGFNALFDLFKAYLFENDGHFDRNEFCELLSKLDDIDYGHIFFTASGIGASRMKNIFLIRCGYKKLEDLNDHKDYLEYVNILN
ncbi:DGQHR domain-containing protein [Shewanella sp. 6_MG-2023]|uniref:DGQHR domain-containing protein n=1 Tax=Shewanella sp. 6_MG-2023 TaxID=3062660 RepID=UPI0026E2D365|nr:DGQHR domain-containing protein [Shewanella sp. 6_MG-2023]MDO6620403.1 DGQHR domain-containing protein [Shewanella sp. 6_MG-2023]